MRASAPPTLAILQWLRDSESSPDPDLVSPPRQPVHTAASGSSVDEEHHCTDVTSSDDFHQDGLHMFVRASCLEAHAENEDQLHHVRLCMEGIPVHGWNNYVASFVIGRGCSLDYIESKSMRREDTRYLELSAWTTNLDVIPKLKWLTLSAHGERRRGRRGL
ncbi:hypothetical protein D1007_22458 [Hordeum vulgare]|nr:hypothetical protein D1007_22458 [Hordeum vulgare]